LNLRPFPKTLTATQQLRESEDRLWALDDTLVEECGEPGEHGINRGCQDASMSGSAHPAATWHRLRNTRSARHLRIMNEVPAGADAL
jgi:hypothetical protein